MRPWLGGSSHEPLTQAPGRSACGAGMVPRMGEHHGPGDWYYLDEEHNCEHCGARLIAVGDEENVTLDLVEENEI